MLGLYKLFPDMFIEQVRQLSYYANLGLFWEVMAPVFFEMSDLYDEGKIKSVPDAMNFLVNGIFAIAGRPSNALKLVCGIFRDRSIGSNF